MLRAWYDDWRDVRRTAQTDRRAIDTRETRASARSPTHQHAVDYIIIIIYYYYYISCNRASSGFHYHSARASLLVIDIYLQGAQPVAAGKEKNGLFFFSTRFRFLNSQNVYRPPALRI